MFLEKYILLILLTEGETMIISLKDGTTKKKKFIIKIDKIAFLSKMIGNSLNKTYILNYIKEWFILVNIKILIISNNNIVFF